MAHPPALWTQAEQVSVEQLRLWLEALDEEAAAQALARGAPSPEAAPERRRAVRRPLPPELPREERYLGLESEVCEECGGALHRRGEEISEQLDYRPAALFVRRTVRPKYACRRCETMKTAPLPVQPIEKGNPGAGLLAHVLISKYADHLPLYRQSQMLERQGVEVHRTTLCDWVARSAALLDPLAERLRRAVLSSEMVHTDDTPVPVLEPGRGRTKQGRLWVYVRTAGPDPPAVVYDYTPSRHQAGPQAFLKGFRGYLQADAYPGYEALYASGEVREVACWMHGRRHFYELVQQGNAPLAAQALEWIGRLYAIEKAVREASPEERAQYRLEHAKPLLEEFKRWLDAEVRRLSPRSALAKAMRYLLNRWASFTRYLEDGRLEIDNGAAERALKAPVLGRKNYLFAGSDAGGKRAAIIYSLMATCKLNGIEPFAYLEDVLSRIAAHPINRVEELLPYNWKRGERLADAA